MEFELSMSSLAFKVHYHQTSKILEKMELLLFTTKKAAEKSDIVL
jgi:hypothetical protein